MDAALRIALQQGIFWITRRIGIGQYATLARCDDLLAYGVTHILNVGEAKSLPELIDRGTLQIVEVPIVDLERMDDETAIRCVNLIHEIMAQPDSKLYVHCVAGQNRSPTVLWLYLLACGMDEVAAQRLIVERSPDAVPGHKQLIDRELIKLVRKHGIDADLRSSAAATEILADANRR